MQYPGGSSYYPMEHQTQTQTGPPPPPSQSYNWASAPPYGEALTHPSSYYAPPSSSDPLLPSHNQASDPPNYAYNPPANYPNSFSQYPSNYAYTNPNPNPNPTAPFYQSPPNPIANPSPSPVYEHSLSYPPESRGYGHGNQRDSFQYPGFEQRYYEVSTPPVPGPVPVGNENNGFDVDDGGLGGEVYAYDGGRTEPYGARGTGTGTGIGTQSGMAFDDYGNLTKITKAIPKTETHDGGNGVQKFRVKILPDSGAQASMDVLCQIGLDGLRMLDPSTFKTLRIYPLETITRWEVNDPSVYTFWAKSSVDIEPRRIRLQSNRYTTSTILDTVAAACVQIREMPEDKSNTYVDINKTSEQLAEKKKGSLADWMTLKKPAEEKQHWVPDEAVTKCTACGTDFGAFCRRHHCRNCGDIYCDKCTQGRVALTSDKDAQPVRVCDRCLAEVTQRLVSTKEKISKASTQRTHEDLAKRLLEEMGRNRKVNSESGGNSGSSSLWSSESNPEGAGKRTREVACPICTVHLQVQVPSSGTETVECGVCQHPFLVSAR